MKFQRTRCLCQAILLTFFLSTFSTSKAFALNCSEVQQLTLLYFKLHYSFNSFDDILSERTLEMFIRAWDPGKLYFFQSDINEIRSKYAKQLDDSINKKDCSPIDFILNRYSQRFEERQQHIYKLLKDKYDFTVDEYMTVDRKSIDFALNQEEINERWRQRVKYQLLSLKTTLDDLDKAKEKLTKRYQLALKRHNELTKDKVLGVFLNAFSSALDPHSSYMGADELEDFRIRTRLSLEGIGASLRSEDGFTSVVSLVKGGAAKNGNLLRINDKIVAVAQGDGEPVDVIDMDLQEVVKMIRGARGTTVKLTIIRDSAEGNRKLVVPIIREKIQLVDQQASSRVVEVVVNEPGKPRTLKIGIISLPSFYIDFEARHRNQKDYRSSSNDTIREIEKLKKKQVDGLILDLRSNGGGSLDESIKIAGLFFKEGPVVQVKTQAGDVVPYYDRDNLTYYDGPLVVMINRHSASASEIFAGAIQDYGRGLIVGNSHTFGKGTVQNLNDVAAKLGAIKVTVNQFYRASGATTQLNGVSADITLPSLVDLLEIGEKFYDYALPFEKIKGVPHQQFNLIKPHLPKLVKNSEDRVKNNEEFKDLLAEIEKYNKNTEERSRVSLKENSDKEKLKDELDEALGEEDEDELKLEEDYYMQEGVKIAADYVQLLSKRQPASLEIPAIKKALMAARAAKSKKEQMAEKSKVTSKDKVDASLGSAVSGTNDSKKSEKSLIKGREIEKKSVDVDKKTIETDKNSIELDKKLIEADKTSIETDKKPIEVDAKTIEVDAKTIETDKKP